MCRNTINWAVVVSIALFARQASATIFVDLGPTAKPGDANRLAELLTQCTGGLDVVVGPDRSLRIGEEGDGNDYADLLREMLDPGSGTDVTLRLGRNLPNVEFDRFNPENGPGTPTSGTQDIDMDDIDRIAQNPGENDPTPWAVLIHAITEVFISEYEQSDYESAHGAAILAENIANRLEGNPLRPRPAPQNRVKQPRQFGEGGWSIYLPVDHPGGALGWNRHDYEGMGIGEGEFILSPYSWFGLEAVPQEGLFFEAAAIELVGSEFELWGDQDEDDDADGRDLLEWQRSDRSEAALDGLSANYGKSVAQEASAKSVPEPASTAMIVIAFSALAASRYRLKRGQ